MKRNLWILAVSLFFTSSIDGRQPLWGLKFSDFSIASDFETRFIPDEYANNAKPPEGTANIDEARFHEIIASIQRSYAGVVSNFGGQLSMAGQWKDDKPNAAATQQGKSWRVIFSGGLARRPELTEDGMVLILCHELGHHLAGFPLASRGFGSVWAANEGQSDYFATHSCARRLWKTEILKNEEFRAAASPTHLSLCERSWLRYDDQNLCLRILSATESMTRTMAVLMNKPIPSYETPDPSAVTRTNDNHPAVQCRMDTSLMGALCLADFSDQLIPGKSVRGGPSSIEAEQEAAQVSCTQFSGFSEGLRPNCWFKPRL